MEWREYETEARRTRVDAVRSMRTEERMTSAALGLAGETGEVVDYVKKIVFHNHDFSRDKAIEEMGDLLWYVSFMLDALHLDIGEVLSRNIEKLRERYPDGFSYERSRNRAEKRED